MKKKLKARRTGIETNCNYNNQCYEISKTEMCKYSNHEAEAKARRNRKMEIKQNEIRFEQKVIRCSLFESFLLRYFDSWLFVQTYFQPQELIIFSSDLNDVLLSTFQTYF